MGRLKQGKVLWLQIQEVIFELGFNLYPVGKLLKQRRAFFANPQRSPREQAGASLGDNSTKWQDLFSGGGWSDLFWSPSLRCIWHFLPRSGLRKRHSGSANILGSPLAPEVENSARCWGLRDEPTRESSCPHGLAFQGNKGESSSGKEGNKHHNFRA